MHEQRLTDAQETERLLLAAGVLVLVVLLEMVLLSRIVRKVRSRPGLPFPDVPWTISDLMGVSLALLPALVLPAVAMKYVVEAWAQSPTHLMGLLRDVRILRLALGFALLVDLGAAALVVWRGRVGHRMGFSEMGFWVPSWKETLLVPFLTLGGFLLAAWGYESALVALEHAPGPQILALLIPLAKSSADRVFVFLTAGVILPILEELLFRGFLLQVLRRYVGSGWALAVSSFLFAIGHFEPSLSDGGWGSLLKLPEIMLLGLLLGTLARRTGSLVPGMVLHMANNLLDVCLLLHP